MYRLTWLVVGGMFACQGGGKGTEAGPDTASDTAGTAAHTGSTGLPTETADTSSTDTGGTTDTGAALSPVGRWDLVYSRVDGVTEDHDFQDGAICFYADGSFLDGLDVSTHFTTGDWVIDGSVVRIETNDLYHSMTQWTCATPDDQSMDCDLLRIPDYTTQPKTEFVVRLERFDEPHPDCP